MSEREQKARKILRLFRATNIEGNEGIIKVNRHPMQVARVLEETEIEGKQHLISEMRPRILTQTLDRVTIAKDLGLRAFFEKPCIKYKDPVIDYTVSPVKIKNVKYHVFSCYFEGDIVNKITNRGTEGQKGTTKVWRWEDCPISNDSYAWEWVSGSADLVSSWVHEFKEKTTGKRLGRISQSASVLKGRTVSKTSHWKSGDLLDFIIQILNILITGGVTTRNGYDVTVNYDWKGSQTKSKHIDKTVWLPIEGNIVWWWD